MLDNINMGMELLDNCYTLAWLASRRASCIPLLVCVGVPSAVSHSTGHTYLKCKLLIEEYADL